MKHDTTLWVLAAVAIGCNSSPTANSESSEELSATQCGGGGDEGGAGFDGGSFSGSGTLAKTDGGGPGAVDDGGLDIPPRATRGASLPYWEYEAEDPSAATTNGTVLPFNNTEGVITSEASGRTAVRLQGTGQYVSFTLQHRANSIVVRYSIPDAPSGGGTRGTLGLYIDGARQDLSLTSRYIYSYGSMAALDGEPSIAMKTPSNGLPHHFFDEARTLFAQEVPVGTVVKLQQDAEDTAGPYVIDLVDFEDVGPPLAQPPGSLAITDPAYGAVAGQTDATTATNNQAAVNKAIADATAQGRVLWIPEGVFALAPQPANLQNVSYNHVPKMMIGGSIDIQGAGMWYSVLQGFGAQFELKGHAETASPPTPLEVTYQFHDFALFGDVTWRQDTNSGWQGFDGPWGIDSTLENVWIEHENVGIWLGNGWDFATPLTSSLTQGLTIHGARIRDLYADGVNMADGTSATTIEQTNVRGSGDDSLVSWSDEDDGDIPCSSNLVQFNTVQAVWHASCFALYGGTSNSFQNNTCADTANLSGMYIATTRAFDVLPFAGTNTILHNTLIRAGGVHGTDDYAGAGALKFFADGKPITNFEIQDILIDSALLAGIQFSGGSSVSSVTLGGITIQSYGAEGPVTEGGVTYGAEGIEIEGSVSGSAEFDNVDIIGGTVDLPLKNDNSGSFTVVKGSGNTGW